MATPVKSISDSKFMSSTKISISNFPFKKNFIVKACENGFAIKNCETALIRQTDNNDIDRLIQVNFTYVPSSHSS